jgi:hypothetical protein
MPTLILGVFRGAERVLVLGVEAHHVLLALLGMPSERIHVPAHHNLGSSPR